MPWERERLGQGSKSKQLVSRRDFLIKSCLWSAPAFLSSGLPRVKRRHGPLLAPLFGPETSLTATGEYRLAPHYRFESPLMDILRNVRPGFDAFITEKYAEEIGAILTKWSSGLQQSSPSVQAIVDSLAPGLQGTSLRPSDRELMRPLAGVEVYRSRFVSDPVLEKQNFAVELGSFFARFSKIDIAEFKVTGISLVSPALSPLPRVETRLRYDLVGPGADFFRGQNVGFWNLEWSIQRTGAWTVQSWKPIEDTESRASGPLFMDITEQALGANVSWQDQLLHGSDYWRTRFDGASGIDVYGHNGVAVGDIDNDGFDDVYVCQPSGLPNRLYRNRADGTFEDVTETAGVGVLDNTACALFADLDNDGRQDLIVVSVDGPLLFLNQGGCRFRFKPDAFRFARPPQGAFTGAALADFDRDGRLDVYFCLYSYYQGLNQYRVPMPFYDARNGPPNFLLHNNADGTFTDVTEATGMNRNNDRYSFTCGWMDYDNDGWPDLYVVNDFGRKNLYRNNGNGTFTDVAEEVRVDDVGAGMSVCWFDYDNDGNQDLYVADMWSAAGERVTSQNEFLEGAPEEVRTLVRKHARGNSLFRNVDDRNFEDVSARAGVEMGRWSWSSDTWDFDHDGYPDLYIANGMISGQDKYELSSFFWRQVVAKTPVEAAPAHAYEQGWNAINELIRSDGTWAGYQRNTFYANNRDGTFSDISGTSGLDAIEDSRCFALADFDHDGRLEVFLKNRNAPQVRILKNVMPGIGSSIALRLRGTKGTRDAIGAAAIVEARKLRQVKFLQAGSGFLSQHTKDLFFGLGDDKGPVNVSVRWPNGQIQEFSNVPLQHRIFIEEGSAAFRAEPFLPAAPDSAGLVPALRRSSEDLSSRFESWLVAPVAAPDFSLPDLAGQVHTLTSFRGHAVLLNFWATESEDSERQLKLLDAWGDAARQEPTVLAVNVEGSDRVDFVRDFVRSRRVSTTVLLASEETTAIYNILYRYLFDRRRDLQIPVSFLVDERGFIVKVYKGCVAPGSIAEDSLHIPVTAAARMQRAFPFAGNWYGGEFQRNQFTYASVFLERGYFDAAIAACRLVLENEPYNAEAYYLLGTICLRKQLPTEARENFERALKLKPAYPETWLGAWNNLGMLAIQAGQSEAAIRDFEQAIRLSPDYSIALQNLGNVYREQGRWTEAQSTLERAVKLDPDDPEACYSLGMVFAQRDETTQAYEYLKRALTLRPDYPEALNNLGILYARTGRLLDAIVTFRKCIQAAPDFDQGYLNLARAYAAKGNAEEARNALRSLLERHPGHAMAQRALDELGP